MLQSSYKYSSPINAKRKENKGKKGFRICFMTSSVINYKALAEIHPEFGEECYVCKKVAKDVFMKHIYFSN